MRLILLNNAWFQSPCTSNGKEFVYFPTAGKQQQQQQQRFLQRTLPFRPGGRSHAYIIPFVTSPHSGHPGNQKFRGVTPLSIENGRTIKGGGLPNINRTPNHFDTVTLSPGQQATSHSSVCVRDEEEGTSLSPKHKLRTKQWFTSSVPHHGRV